MLPLGYRYVTGGMQDKCQPSMQLDAAGDIDGLICYDGQGFETSAGPQIQPDTGEQVFVSGDGTVNYQSLRHAATWKSSCEVDCFELPGCDHRGVSYDPRMLDLLRGVLELGADDKKSIKQDIARIEKEAHERFGGVVRKCASFICCVLVAKAGLRSMNMHRQHLSYAVKVMAFLSLVICIFVIIYGVNEDYDFVKDVSWAGGSFDYNETDLADLAEAFPLEWGLGVLTYSYLGQMVPTNYTCLTYTTIELFERNTSCAAITQNLTVIPLTVNNSPYRQGCVVVELEAAKRSISLGVHMSSRGSARMEIYNDSATNSQTRQQQIYNDLTDLTCTSSSGSPAFNQSAFLNDCVSASVVLDGETYEFSYKLKVVIQPSGYNVMAQNGSLSRFSLAGGIPFDDGTGCKALSCDGPEQATLQTYDPTCTTVESSEAVSMPLNTTEFPLSFQITNFSCKDYSGYGPKCTVGFSNEQHRCTYSYYRCKELDEVNTGGTWQEVSPGCIKGPSNIERSCLNLQFLSCFVYSHFPHQQSLLSLFSMRVLLPCAHPDE